MMDASLRIAMLGRMVGVKVGVVVKR